MNPGSSDKNTGWDDALAQESDRGCVLIAFEILHETLTKVLRANFFDPENKVVVSETNRENPRALLGNFWAKETVLFMMGVIDNDTRQALAALRSIRNSAAHGIEPLKLDELSERVGTIVDFTSDSKDVIGLLQNLKSMLPQNVQIHLRDIAQKLGFPIGERFRFIVAFVALVHKLEKLVPQSSGVDDASKSANAANASLDSSDKPDQTSRNS